MRRRQSTEQEDGKGCGPWARGCVVEVEDGETMLRVELLHVESVCSRLSCCEPSACTSTRRAHLLARAEQRQREDDAHAHSSFACELTSDKELSKSDSVESPYLST